MGTGQQGNKRPTSIWKKVVSSPLQALFSKAADFAVPLSPMKSTGWLMLKNCLTWSLNTIILRSLSGLPACWQNNSCEKWVADQKWISCRVNGRNKDLVEVKPRRRSKWLAARQGWNMWKAYRKAQRVVNQVAIPSIFFQSFFNYCNISEKMEMLFSLDLSFNLGSLWKIAETFHASSSLRSLRKASLWSCDSLKLPGTANCQKCGRHWIDWINDAIMHALSYNMCTIQREMYILVLDEIWGSPKGHRQLGVSPIRYQCLFSGFDTWSPIKMKANLLMRNFCWVLYKHIKAASGLLTSIRSSQEVQRPCSRSK